MNTKTDREPRLEPRAGAPWLAALNPFRLLLVALVVWVLGIGLVLLVTDKEELHLLLNAFHFPGSDGIFRLLSNVGDRRMAWFVGLAFLASKRFSAGATVLVATIGAGLATEFFKYQVFGPLPRPVAFFGADGPLRLVPGYENHLDYSMPSGHSAIILALVTTLIMQTTSRWQQGVLIVLALGVAFSRVYLSEHFLEDVYWGALLGVACGLLACALVRWVESRRRTEP